MKAITLRDLPQELARRIRRRADESGLSLNKTVIRLLEEAFGIPEGRKKAPAYSDLDALIGGWSKEDAAEFEAALKRQRKIDPELWK